MPIRGLTDRGLSFPEIGQIRKGAKETVKRQDGSTYEKPVDLAYFRVTFDEREAKAEQTFREVYGEQPTAIRVILPFNEIERMWDAWLEAYTAGRMVARSDGEYYLYLIDTKTGELLVKNGMDVKTNLPRPYVEGQPVGTYKDNKGKEQVIFCKPSGRLKVIIPELARAAYLTVLTTSVHDIANISDQLRAFQTLNNGRIAGIPLILRRRPKKISTPNADGTRARRVKWLLSIEADPEWVMRALQETKRLALPGNGLALPSGSSEPEDEHLSGDEQPDYDPDDYEEGEYRDVEEQAKAEAPLNGSARPYTQETLKSRLVERAAEYAGKKISEKQIGLIAMLIEKAFAGQNNAVQLRHDVQFALFGHESLEEVDPALLLAALNIWLKPTQDSGGDYNPDPMAVREINRILTEALKQEGQAELF